MSFIRVLIGSAEKPKRSFGWSLVSVRQQVAVMKLCSQHTLPKNNVQSQQQKHQENMSIDFKNNIKIIRMTSPDTQLFARGNCPEPCLGQFFLEYRPIICHFMRNEKSLSTYLIHENSKCQHFLFLKRQPQKRTNFSNCYLIFKGPPFQYHKVRHQYLL